VIGAEDLDFIASLARTQAGLMLRDEKLFFIQSRLGGLARREGLASVPALIQRLKARTDDGLAKSAVEALAAPDTAFFRDRAAFDQLAEDVLPALAAARAGGEVRIWCAGCSTGQEAYSLAMLADRVRTRAPAYTPTILGTDLSEHALEKARAGLYTQFEVQRGLPIRILIDAFERAEDSWRVGPRLRQAVRWQQVNLIDDFSGLGRFDVILCRNVLSYFDETPRIQVLNGMAATLADDGRLLLGEGEDFQMPEGFEPIRGASGLFRRDPTHRRAAA
jgi:chemotaxis protein methyltransferase CheR